MALKIALVEDDPVFSKQLLLTLGRAPHQCSHFLSSRIFVESSDFNQDWDLIIYDLSYPEDPSGLSSIERIPQILQRHPDSTLLVCSAARDVQIMKDCIAKGASQFIWKEHFLSEAESLLSLFEVIDRERNKMESLFVGESIVMKHFRHSLLNAKTRSQSDVLVEGESGSGKELVAHALHNEKTPLISINASAIAPDLFESEFFGAEKGSFTGAVNTKIGHLESAQGGILFLDEIQNFPLSQQAKLLRVLETRKFQRVGSSQERVFHGRMVFASNRNLKECVEKGLFREDLYYRMTSHQLYMPPLRFRRSDIVLLAKHFLKTLPEGKGFELAPNADSFFRNLSYEWPGNVRELRNLIRRACVESKIPILENALFEKLLAVQDKDEVAKFLGDAANLPSSETEFYIQWDDGLDSNLERLERQMLLTALSKWEPHVARDKLNISKSRYYDKMKHFQLHRPDKP